MHRALDQARAAAPPDRAQVRASLMRAYVGVSANAGWLERTRRAIISALKRFLERIFSYAGFGSIVAWVVVGTLLVSGVWALSRAFVPARRVRLRNADRPEEVDWRRLSVEALARGDAPEAVRAHYRLLLHALAREGILRESPSLTAGECRRSVGVERPSLVPAVSRATGVFERVAYGEQELRPGDIEAMQNAEAEVSSR